jgi:uncharacterized protein (DUF427 family)
MWLYNDKEVTEEDIEGYVAFVYLITNLQNNKRYIGKKLLTKTRSKVIKGRVRKKKVVTESDWRDYYGSNEILKQEVLNLGSDKFKREILRFCKTRGTANYFEAKLQMEHAVLEKPDEWYNEQIRVRVHRSHIKC